MEEMAKKTAIRRLFKYLPVSIEIQRAVSMDEKEPLTSDHHPGSLCINREYSVIDNSENNSAWRCNAPPTWKIFLWEKLWDMTMLNHVHFVVVHQ